MWGREDPLEEAPFPLGVVVSMLYVMSYTTADARQLLLDTLGDAVDQIGIGVSCLSEAYDKLDDQSADRLEETLFTPVQVAYGRAKRTHVEFCERHHISKRQFVPSPANTAGRMAVDLIDQAIEAVEEADRDLVVLQDSMLPIEAGDAELRSGLVSAREPIGSISSAAREFKRTLGR
jgi:hypothetical protein